MADSLDNDQFEIPTMKRSINDTDLKQQKKRRVSKYGRQFESAQDFEEFLIQTIKDSLSPIEAAQTIAELKIEQQPKLPDGLRSSMVVSASALRCIDVMKQLKSKYAIAKCFAKHIKAQAQIDHIQSHDVQVFCGTPNRLLKLIELDASQFSEVQVLIVDMNKDPKDRTIFDMKEGCADLCRLISTLKCPVAYLPNGSRME